MTMTDNRTSERVDHPPRVREAIDELMREKDATDNRTTELREKLTERGIEYETNDHMGVCETSWNGFTAMQLTPGAKLMMAFTPEQAIAATLGSERHAYEQRITGDGSDWGEIMRDAYDELMAAACESCTPEQMEQLADYISAELNARAERTCRIVEYDEAPYPVCSECGAVQPDDYTVYFCWSCGAKVRDE